jgi:glycosyltransferase involved in cell wall biosynthesis
MRVLFISQYFPPEVGAPSARVSEMAKEWVRLGHEVTVLTAFPSHPYGVKRPEDRGVAFRREQWEGVEVLRCWHWAVPNKGNLKRMLMYFTFMKSASFFGVIKAKRPDVVVATSPQLLVGLAGWFLAFWYRVPFVFEVRDLWPESVVAVDAMRENLIVKMLKKLAAFLYATSKVIVTVGEGYRRKIIELYHVQPTKIFVLPNGFDAATFKPGRRLNAARTKWGWGNKKVVLYLGTHGMAHGLQNVLEAARLLRNRKDVLFVFVGEGADKEHLKNTAEKWRLKNVQFIDQQPKDQVTQLYAACDLGLVHLRNTPLFQEVLPSKIFEYLAMERPVLVAVGGEARKLVEIAGAGVYVPPENPKALAVAVQKLLLHPASLALMGRKGRLYVQKYYDRKRLATRYIDFLSTLVQKTE